MWRLYQGIVVRLEQLKNYERISLLHTLGKVRRCLPAYFKILSFLLNLLSHRIDPTVYTAKGILAI